MQCCRQLLLKLPPRLLPQTQQCPMAPAFLSGPLTEDDVKQWPCWTSFPIGPQRDACEALELCLDPGSKLHSKCGPLLCLLHELRGLHSPPMFSVRSPDAELYL